MNTSKSACAQSNNILYKKQQKKYLSNFCHTSLSRPFFKYSFSLLSIHCWTSILLLLLATPVCDCLRVVSLNVPARVRKGTDLELVCLYDLGNATLYSLKWFYRTHKWERDGKEFFRYTPRAIPHKQVFALDGIQVDIDKSSSGSIYLKETRASGMYMCEISAEGTFQTVHAEKMMSVINSSSILLHNKQQYELQAALFAILFTIFLFG